MEFVTIKGQKYPINILIQNKITSHVKLRHLTIKNSDIKSLTEIESIRDRNIESLNIGDQITSLEGIECFSNLRSLSIGNQISEIKYLESLPHLTDLYVYGSFSKIQNLNNPNLEVLQLEGNITKIDGLESLTNLRSLYLDNNSISEIVNLDNLQNLHRLSLANNKITQIDSLDSLDLYNLNLEGNQISEIENIDSLRRLGSLNLSYNNISKLKGLGNLENLSMLYLNDNKIRCIQGFSALKKLQEVHLDHNQINYISGIETIKQGAKVTLQENPIPKDQLDCFRYHYEIYDHERGDEMGDFLFQMCISGQISSLERLLLTFKREFDEIKKNTYDNGNYLTSFNGYMKALIHLEKERLYTRRLIWQFKSRDFEGKSKDLAIKFSETAKQVARLIKNIYSLNLETENVDVIKKVFLLQAELFIKRASFYYHYRNDAKILEELHPFFTSWDNKLGKFLLKSVIDD